ncbi:MAG: MBL fold metallo-hydrolase [Dokdonella sp.]
MKLWSLMGNSQRLDGGAMFGNAPKAVWQKWTAADETNAIPLACRCLLAEDLDGRTVLFETGIGAFLEPKLRARYGVVEEQHVLLDSLGAAGFSHDSIDVVVLSHLHFDHAGGLLAGWVEGSPLQLLFPNATFVVGARHWQRALDPHPRDKASFIVGLPDLLRASGRLELVEGSTTPALGDSVRFTFSDGHTPGLMLAEIVAEDGGVVFCADLVPGRPWVHLPITMGYDRFPELLIDEKRAFLDDKIARHVRLFFTHDTGCALATVERDVGGRYTTRDEHAQLCGLALAP